MPYVDPAERNGLDIRMPGDALYHDIAMPHFAGHLNYVITQLCQQAIKASPDGACYTNYNAIIGVLECVKQEFYRRAVVPYEEQKREENGDVYEQEG